MDVETKDLAAVGTVASIIGACAGVLSAWAVTAINAGRSYQKMNDKIDQHSKDIENLNQMIDKLHKCFVTENGEPRLISFAAHDILQANCQRRMDERNERLRERLQGHDVKLDKILEDLACLRGVATANGSFKGGVKK